MGFQIGDIQAGTANFVEGTQNIGTQGGGNLILSPGEQEKLVANLDTISIMLSKLERRVFVGMRDKNLGTQSAALDNQIIQAMIEGEQFNTGIENAKGSISPKDKQNANAYLELAESAFRAGRELYADVGPLIDKFLPAVAAAKNILGI